MTTTVLIGTQGNKNVKVKVTNSNGDVIIEPGRWMTLNISGDQSLTVQEDGGFVVSGGGGPDPIPRGGGGPDPVTPQ